MTLLVLKQGASMEVLAVEMDTACDTIRGRPPHRAVLPSSFIVAAGEKELKLGAIVPVTVCCLTDR